MGATLVEVAAAVHVDPKTLRSWMELVEDPCPPGDPTAPIDVAAVSAWMGRTGKGARSGRQEALTAARNVHGVGRAAQLAAAAGASVAASEAPPSPPPNEAAAQPPAGPPEEPEFSSVEEERVYWDAKLKRLKCLQLDGVLVPRDASERRNLLRTQRLVAALARVPDRYSLLLAHRDEKAVRTILQAAVDEIRSEMAGL